MNPSPQGPRLALLALCLGVVGAAGVLTLAGNASFFGPYFGGLDPVLATVIAVMLGAPALLLLDAFGWFSISAAGRSREAAWVAAALATVLAMIVIFVDLRGGFPRDINVAFPASLLFYPLMGFVVEAVFHLAPLAVLLLLLGSLVAKRHRKWAVWTSLVLVAPSEAIFQLWIAPPDAGWVNVFLGAHLLVFGGLQVWLFRRYGFFTMYFFRLVYYSYWHILWGHARLQLLF